eukprot:CAMPEP_0184866438 /NCGR_PEP_ID=MMETSP0580-20130426/22345_1 /TAXON_ID=1118495 /ORGANISM="Dactyliosolen fragilissimus" /LENGTH=856 /DNA_ID=CAMNT_0027366133 /DNA_START=152 /DNA_END=2722 /DNA_ORIENTATION=+
MPYVVKVSRRFIYLSLTATILLAFTIGRAARIILIEGPKKALFAPHDTSAMFVRPDYHEGYQIRDLPTPVLLEGKTVPSTLYRGANLDTSGSATASSLLLEKIPKVSDETIIMDEKNSDGLCLTDDNGNKQCSRGNEPSETVPKHDDEEHLPAGQHLLVDIKNVDGSFLNSEKRLAQAMVDVVNESKLTLLSYHCHSLLPKGVSCVGVLLESHISFHTWPDEGVITLDLFTCGSAHLIPVMPLIKRLFAVPQEPHIDNDEKIEPTVVWSHVLRGWGESKANKHLSEDLGFYVLEKLHYDMKEEIAWTQTQFQRIDIYDVIRSDTRDYLSYEKSISENDSYEAKNAEFYRPERIVYLDGILQSTRYGLEAYHEALVHPGMLTHPNPKRIAIVGGGEAATLREVLKHKTVEKVKMIEIDEEMVEFSRKYLPDWSDCSDIQGSTKWCGDDPRAELYFEDALAWFIDNYHKDEDDSDDEESTEEVELFDVIIVDALDPEDDVPFAQLLYQNSIFVQSLYNALSDDGVLVLQLGAAPNSDAPSEQYTFSRNRHSLIQSIINESFQSVHVYEESHCLFHKPWQYFVALKDRKSRNIWHQNSAYFDIELAKRILPSVSGFPLLSYFDSATMTSYKIPHKVYENIFCKGEQKSEYCEIFMLSEDTPKSIPITDFEVKMSSISETAGRGLYTKVFIPEGSAIAMTDRAKSFYFGTRTVQIIEAMMTEYDSDVEDVYEFMDGYGWESNLYGTIEYGVDDNILMFVNHGCGGTHNIGEYYDESSENNITDTANDRVLDVFDIAHDRHLRNSMFSFEYALRDIQSGEEIMSDYTLYIIRDITSYAKHLVDVCNRQEVGSITKIDEVFE